MDSKIEFAKELPIENETQNTTLQGLEWQQIKKECTDDEYVNFTSEENVKVYLDVPAVNNNSDHSNIEFAEEKIYVKEENSTSESFEVREIKSEFIDGDACGQDVEYNFNVPAGNNSNEVDNSHIKFSEEKIYVKKENYTSERWEIQEIKSEFVDCHGYGQDVEYNFDESAANNSNERDNSKIEFDEKNIHVKKEIDNSGSLEVQYAKVGGQLRSRGCNTESTTAIINARPSHLHVREHRNGSCSPAQQSNEYLGAEPHTCTLCNKSFGTSPDLTIHERTHREPRPFKCTVCRKAFHHSATLAAHERSHSSERKYICSVCFKAYKLLSNLMVHKRIHNGERPYKCTICNKAFTLLSKLNAHERIHSDEKPYKCTVCNKAFKQWTTLKRHKRTHSDNTSYKCTVCSKIYTSSNSLTKHQRMHNGYRPYKCNVCNKTYISMSHLMHHKRIHSDDKPYKCTVCNKAFTYSSTLNSHRHTHSDVRPYNCSVCNKTFKLVSGLNAHERTHSGSRPYQCTVCNKAFMQASRLARHKRTHTNGTIQLH